MPGGGRLLVYQKMDMMFVAFRMSVFMELTAPGSKERKPLRTLSCAAMGGFPFRQGLGGVAVGARYEDQEQKIQ